MLAATMGEMNKPSKKIVKLCAHRLHYFKLEGKYAKLRREVEMRITEEHLKALDRSAAVHFDGDSYGASIEYASGAGGAFYRLERYKKAVAAAKGE